MIDDFYFARRLSHLIRWSSFERFWCDVVGVKTIKGRTYNSGSKKVVQKKPISFNSIFIQ